MWDVAALNPSQDFSESGMWTYRELPVTIFEPEGMIFPGIMEVIVMYKGEKKKTMQKKGRTMKLNKICISLFVISATTLWIWSLPSGA